MRRILLPLADLDQRIAEHYWSKNYANWTHADRYAVAYLPTHLGMVEAWPRLEELLLNSSFVRTLSELSNPALADAFHWAHASLDHISEGPRRTLLLQLSTITEQLRLFTGRSAEMRFIESFLTSEDRQHLLVVGPPGIGKTSLVAQIWVRHFDQCLLAKLHPLESLLAALTRVAKDSPLLEDHWSQEKSLSPSVRSYQQILDMGFGSGRNVCIIIDELDAARDPSFDLDKFPLVLPPGFRIIWASRQMAALSRLAPVALVLDLAEMGRSEILDLCRRSVGMGVIDDVVERIAELSHGSPLYINLIAKEIQRGVPCERILKEMSSSLSELYEMRVQDLERSHPEMRERLAWLVGAITSHGQAPRVRLKDVAVQFSDGELDAMKMSGLLTVEHNSEGTILGVLHATVIDFLRQRYGVGRSGKTKG